MTNTNMPKQAHESPVMEIDVLKRTQEALAGSENMSVRIEMICGRYLDVVADELHRIPLSKAEWGAALDANNGACTSLFGDDFGWRFSWANDADYDEVGEKWASTKSAWGRRCAISRRPERRLRRGLRALLAAG